MLLLGILLGLAVEQFGPEWPPAQPDLSNPWADVHQLAEQGQWWQVWWAAGWLELTQHRAIGATLLALLAGGCWLAFLLQAIQVRPFRDPALWCALAGLLMGAVNIWPTDFLILWQKIGWNLHDSQQLVPGLKYYIIGVGLREESAKLVCLLPLMPWLLRIRSELVVLGVSACVGLGFSVVENMQYFETSVGQDALSRYLTANPMHLTLTGLAGLAVYRGLRDPKSWGPHALAVFGLLVFAHGLYDAFIVIPALSDYSLAGTILFALVVYQFFHELRACRTTGSETISLSANFLFGVSLLTASTFVYLSATIGTQPAMDGLATDALGLSLMVYLFLREMPETMVTV